MPLIQLALDTPRLGDALNVLAKVNDQVDIVEAGTVLCLGAGLTSIASLREVAGSKPIVADIRIGRAGRLFTDLAIAFGADLVTVLGEASLQTLEDAISAARSKGKKIEIELPHGMAAEQVLSLTELGAAGMIVHHKPGSDFRPDSWISATLDLLSQQQGPYSISLAGGLDADNISALDPNWKIDVLVVGSEVTKSENPKAAIRAIIDAMNERASKK